MRVANVSDMDPGAVLAGAERSLNVLWLINHLCYDGSLHGGGRLFTSLLAKFGLAHAASRHFTTDAAVERLLAIYSALAPGRRPERLGEVQPGRE